MLANQHRLRRSNPVSGVCGTGIGAWLRDDRVTWRTTDGVWLAQLQRSQKWLAGFPPRVAQPPVRRLSGRRELASSNDAKPEPSAASGPSRRVSAAAAG